MTRLFAALVPFCFFLPVLSFGQNPPIVGQGGVLNNASYRLDGLPGSGVARGSMIAVFGSNMGPAVPVSAGPLPLPLELAGTRVDIRSGGQLWQAPIFVSSANQLAAIVPSAVPAGDATLTVVYNGVSSQPVTVRVVDHALGIFSRNLAGFGPGIVQNWISASEQPVNSLTRAAHVDQVMILWGTGLGPIDGDDAAPPPVGDLPVNVEVWVGDRQAQVRYAGRSPQFPAIDQINFVIPAGVTGCYVPVVVIVNGVASNYVTISIAGDGDVCSDPHGFLLSDLQTAASAGEVRVGQLSLSRIRALLVAGNEQVEIHLDELFGSFRSYRPPDMFASMGIRQTPPPLGACVTYGMRLDENGEANPVPDDRIGGRQLSAGPRLTLQGPNGDKTINRDGDYEAEVGGGPPGDPNLQPDYFDPGSYTIRGGADADEIGPFEATLTLPAGFTWINRAQISEVPRDQDLTVTWTASEPANEFVIINGQSVNHEDNVAGSFVCTAPATAGSFTVPSRVLRTIPPSSVWDAAAGFPPGLLFVNAEPYSAIGRFTAPRLDGGYFFYSDQSVRNVDFR